MHDMTRVMPASGTAARIGATTTHRPHDRTTAATADRGGGAGATPAAFRGGTARATRCPVPAQAGGHASLAGLASLDATRID